ncbi:RelE/StbE replicon stabilization toxin [hydrothermal vent metagenome]|uniref:RelE/StbE replicon stabilization toxin n=1 Tax=hydrothermal vent metagenome TaxID=652676 RepID=A0A1W1EI93_9ZZZZ
MIINIDDKAIKDLSKIDKKEAIKIFNKIETLENFPKIPNIKRLNNFEPPYRLRVGNYRVLFNIEKNIIIVYRVKHRNRAYD